MTQPPPKESPYPALLRWGLAIWVWPLVLCILPWTEDPAGPVKLLATQGFAAVLALTWLAAVAAGGEGWRLRAPGLVILAAWLAWLMAAALLSPHPAVSIDAWRTWLLMAVLALLAAQAYREPGQAWPLAYSMVGALSASSLYGFAQYAGYDPFPWSNTSIEEYRGLPSTFANPNYAGHALMLGVVLALAGAWRLHRSRRAWPALLCLAAAGILSTHLAMTAMRGARVGLLAAVFLLIIWMGLRRLGRPHLWTAVTSVTLAAAAGILAILGGLMMLRGYTPENPPPVGGSMVLRLNGYHGAAQMVLDRPVLGYGPGMYARESIPYWTPYEQQWAASEGRRNTHVHNSLLEASVDSGLPGGFFLLGIYLSGLLGMLWLAGASPDPKARHTAAALAALVAAFAADGLFGFNLRVPVSGMLFMVLFGISQGLLMPTAARMRGWARVGAAVLLACVALANAFVELQRFHGERFFQQANGAVAWSERQAAEGNNTRARQTLEAALGLLDSAAMRLPADGRVPEMRANVHLRLGNFEEAGKATGEALRRQPHLPLHWMRKARVLLNQAQQAGASNAEAMESSLDAAWDATGQAMVSGSYFPGVHELRAWIQFFRGELANQRNGDAAPHYQAAAEAFARAQVLGGKPTASKEGARARALEAVGNTEEALRAYRRAAEAGPANEQVWRDFLALAREQDALAYLADTASRLRGQVSEAGEPGAQTTLTYYLAQAYAAMPGSKVLARDLVTQAIEDTPDAMRLWALWAELRDAPLDYQQLHAALRDWAGESGGKRALPEPLGALAAMEAPLTPDPYLEQTAALAAQAQQRGREQGREAAEKAYAWLAHVYATRLERPFPLTQPQRAQAWLDLGLVFSAAGQWEMAEPALREAADLAPLDKQATPMVHLSQALAMQGQYEEALQWARKAVRFEPAMLLTRMNLAQRLLENGAYAEARFEFKALEKKVRRDPAASAEVAAGLRAADAALAGGNAS